MRGSGARAAKVSHQGQQWAEYTDTGSPLSLFADAYHSLTACL